MSIYLTLATEPTTAPNLGTLANFATLVDRAKNESAYLIATPSDWQANWMAHGRVENVLSFDNVTVWLFPDALIADPTTDFDDADPRVLVLF